MLMFDTEKNSIIINEIDDKVVVGMIKETEAEIVEWSLLLELSFMFCH